MAITARTRRARRLRRDATEIEKQLWHALRAAMADFRFRRQHPIGAFIVDFACPSRRLAIELDGGQHGDRQQADATRTEEIARRGYRVIRFWNNDVAHNLAGVLETIRRELDVQ